MEKRRQAGTSCSIKSRKGDIWARPRRKLKGWERNRVERSRAGALDQGGQGWGQSEAAGGSKRWGLRGRQGVQTGLWGRLDFYSEWQGKTLQAARRGMTSSEEGPWGRTTPEASWGRTGGCTGEGGEEGGRMEAGKLTSYPMRVILLSTFHFCEVLHLNYYFKTSAPQPLTHWAPRGNENPDWI